jgi:hypothetical protein
MQILKYNALVNGLMVPISTFLNLQSSTIPLTRSSTMSLAQRLYEANDATSKIALVCSFLSLIFGVFACLSLIVRMLEIRIKWATRFVMMGSLFQGILSLCAFCLFMNLTSSTDDFTAAIVYAVLASVIALASSCMTAYHIYQKESNKYLLKKGELSLVQRQMILIAIFVIAYISIMSGIFGFIEGWDYEVSLYWCIVTIATIGFGDFAPKTTLGRLLVLPFAFLGIMLMGTTLYSMHLVELEVLAIRLTSHARLQIEEDEVPEKGLKLQRFQTEPANAPSLRDRLGSFSLRKPTEKKLSISAPISGPLNPVTAPEVPSSSDVAPEKIPEKVELDPTPNNYIGNLIQAVVHKNREQREEKLKRVASGELALRKFHTFDERDLPLRRFDTEPTHNLPKGIFKSQDATHSLILTRYDSEQPKPKIFALFKSPVESPTHAESEIEVKSISKSLKSDKQEPAVEEIEGMQPPLSHDQTLQNLPSLPSNEQRDGLRYSRFSSKYISLTRIALDLPENPLLQSKIITSTHAEIRKRAIISFVILILHILLSGLLLSYLERWSVPDGFYFAFSAFMTIGYGDFTLKNYLARSIFIWYVFMVAVSTTNFYTMMTELAVDNWQVTRKTIAKRVERYEYKSKWMDMQKPSGTVIRRRNSIG